MRLFRMSGRMIAGQRSRRMMRIRHIDDVLHERSAITSMTVPFIGEQIASFETPLEVVPVEHREAVPHSVHALEPDPSLAVILPERLTESVSVAGFDVVQLAEPRLNDAVITSRLERLRALREGRANVTGCLSRRDSDGVSVHVAVHSNLWIEVRQLAKRAHCELDLSLVRE